VKFTFPQCRRDTVALVEPQYSWLAKQTNVPMIDAQLYTLDVRNYLTRCYQSLSILARESKLYDRGIRLAHVERFSVGKIPRRSSLA
jgi:hypothetical protein